MTNYILSNIHDDFDGYNKLIKLYDDHKDDLGEIIELNLTIWFDANLSAVLGAILDKIISNGFNTIKFNISDNIQTILQKNGFLSFYGFDKTNDTYGSTIEYKKFKTSDSRYFSEYIENDLLYRKELPNMSNAVHDKIGESIHEMFINAKIHSETEFIYTCGQFFPKEHNLNFTIVDTGIGFAKKIEKALECSINSIEAIKWAIKDGNTTKQNVSGGLGLTLLKEFILKNKGIIQIISGNAYYKFANGIENTQELDKYFDGSVISMTFKTNDIAYYRLKDEIDDDIF